MNYYVYRNIRVKISININCYPVNIHIIYIHIFVSEKYANSSSSNFQPIKNDTACSFLELYVDPFLSFFSLYSHVVPRYFKREQRTWKYTQIKDDSYRVEAGTRCATSMKLRWRLRERSWFQGYVKDTLIYSCATEINSVNLDHSTNNCFFIE